MEQLITDPNEVNQDYAARRSEQLDIIASAKRTTWKGKMTRQAMASMSAAQSALANIDAIIAADRATVAGENEVIKADYATKLERDANKAFSIAGLGQIVQLGCIIFIGLWHTGVDDEAGIDGEDAGARVSGKARKPAPIGYRPGVNLVNAAPPYQEEATAEGASRPKIGFRHYPQGRPPPLPPPPPAPVVHEAHEAPAATRSDKPDPNSMEANTRLNSWRSYKRNLDAIRKRTTPSAKANQEKYRKGMAYEAEELARMGLKIELKESPKRCYALIPI